MSIGDINRNSRRAFVGPNYLVGDILDAVGLQNPVTDKYEEHADRLVRRGPQTFNTDGRQNIEPQGTVATSGLDEDINDMGLDDLSEEALMMKGK